MATVNEWVKKVISYAAKNGEAVGVDDEAVRDFMKDALQKCACWAYANVVYREMSKLSDAEKARVIAWTDGYVEIDGTAMVGCDNWDEWNTIVNVARNLAEAERLMKSMNE